MAHKMSLLAGIAIGAGGALLAREIIGSRRGLKWHDTHWREGHLEPEDSRSESHVPNLAEMDRERYGRMSRTGTSTEAEVRRAMGSSGPIGTPGDTASTVGYTRDPRSSAASGGTAPFVRKEKEA